MITIKWSDSVVEEEEEKGEKGQRDAKVGMEDRGNLAGSNKVKYLLQVFESQVCILHAPDQERGQIFRLRDQRLKFLIEHIASKF